MPEISTQMVLTLVILVFSVILHEISHGVVAHMMGDPTAKYEGRLTLNPIPHIDPISSILLPLTLIFFHSPVVFGAAKPVPVNFFNIRNFKLGMVLVSLAGPLTNLTLALIFAIPLRLGLAAESPLATSILIQAVLLNTVLGVFNLIPIPPLDGSKVLAGIFGSHRMIETLLDLERWGFLIILIFFFFGLVNIVLLPPVAAIFHLFTGVSLFSVI